MKTHINLCGISLQSPILIASGIYGLDYNSLLHWPSIGAVITKTITTQPRAGNLPPRICELETGMLNSIGLQNPGIAAFIAEELPQYEAVPVPVIVSFSGETIETFGENLQQLENAEHAHLIAGYEVNVSCPNVKEGGIAFGTSAPTVEKLVSHIKKYTQKPLIIKLSPNVTQITDIAKAAEAGGADALSLINTLLGMRIDIRSQRPQLGNLMGGYSGKGVLPIGIRAVFQCAQAVNIPLVGLGGIDCANDVLEYFLAGASAVEVGTAFFVDPRVSQTIVQDLHRFLETQTIDHIAQLTAKAHHS